MVLRFLLPLFGIALLLTAPLTAQRSPQVTITEMGRGINLGNTLEPPLESAWNNGPAQEYYFDDYVEAGFRTVRIPVRWDQHTGNTPPYLVDAVWMDRVEQVVNWALERDLFVILNAHHEDWLKQGYANATLRERFDNIWKQVAARFQNAPDKLLFEIINEPFGMTRDEVDELNARILGIIRQTNPTRLVIYSGNDYSNAEHMIAAAIPDDPYLLAYYHSYDPWPFAGQGQGTWGTEVQRNAVRTKFQQVADWSADTGIPVMISEFGAVRETPFNDRMAFYAQYVEEAVSHNIAFQVWDDGGMFRVYRRGERTWNEEKDILIGTYPDSPTNMQAEVVGDTLVALSWTNRTSSMNLVVERRLLDGTFEAIATLPADEEAYHDTTMAGGATYQYRVIAMMGRGDHRYGYPVQIYAPPTVRAPFLGAPHPVPGTIQAEDFDEGGEGLTYHDTDLANIPNAYRTNVSVDIEPRDDGGYHVAYIESGEWLEYTVDVAEAGTYDLTTYVASLDGGGRFRYSAGDSRTSILVPPQTNSWQTLEAVNTTIDLAAGEQILRLDLLTARPFNVDRFVLELASPTSRETEPALPSFALYPNPAHTFVEVDVPLTGTPHEVVIVNVLGQTVRQAALGGSRQVDLRGLPPGVYLVRVQTQAHVVGQQLLVKR